MPVPEPGVRSRLGSSLNPPALPLSDMARRFARMRPGAPPFDPGFTGVPSDGMCLNVFLVLRKPDDPRRVLLGRVARDVRWEEAGALDLVRLDRIGERWMLPASQLILLEGPEEGARRVGREQLGVELRTLPSPLVVSDSYARKGTEATDPHWDLHFIYDLPGPAGVPASPLWKELEYVPVTGTSKSAIARDHGDILELVGLRFGP